MKRIYSIILIVFIVFGCKEEKYIPTYSPSEFQKKLVGEWTGYAEASDRLGWKIDITFTESGHYIASAYDVSDTLEIGGPFLFGHKRVDYPDGGIIIFPPSPDIPCQSFIIDYVLNMKGYGVLSVGRESEIDGEIYNYFCSEYFEIRNLEFTNGDNKVIFSLFQLGYELDDWYLKYNLFREIANTRDSAGH